MLCGGNPTGLAACSGVIAAAIRPMIGTEDCSYAPFNSVSLSIVNPSIATIGHERVRLNDQPVLNVCS